VGLKPITVENWLPSVLGRCWLGHPACKNRPPKGMDESTHSLHIPRNSRTLQKQSTRPQLSSLGFRLALCLRFRDRTRVRLALGTS